MESIASEANVSKVTLYKYFSDKQLLFEQILQASYLEEYNEVVGVIHSDIPFIEKIDKVVKARIKKYYDKSKPIYKGEFTVSSELQTFIDEYTGIMNGQRKILYDQGKEEGFISNEIKDETLEMYFRVIQKGLVSEFKDLGDLDTDNLKQLLQILYAGILSCNKEK